MTTDLYIIAAGRGSRMGGNVPKALIPISGGIPNLTTTLQQVSGKFNRVFVVINALIEDEWKKYANEVLRKFPGLIDQAVYFVPIQSGLGDGHAVMKGFEGATDITRNTSSDVVICWGDVFFPHSETIDELLSKKYTDSSGFIPAVKENNPYVTLLVDDKLHCMSADFSKYGENHPSGFHDQSVFRFKREYLWTTLNTLHDAFWKNGRYITPGGELSLLHTFHYLYNTQSPAQVYETDYPTRSFNTPEEVAAIQQEINQKWKNSKSQEC